MKIKLKKSFKMKIKFKKNNNNLVILVNGEQLSLAEKIKKGAGVVLMILAPFSRRLILLILKIQILKILIQINLIQFSLILMSLIL
jgi:hypothetical protein